MDIYQVIIRPLVTEKGTFLAGRRFEGRGGVYCFEVHPDARKVEVKEAVEKIYGVKVNEVRSQLDTRLKSAQTQVEQAVREAKAPGGSVDQARTKTEAALKNAQTEADAAVAKAKVAGSDQAEIDKIKTDAQTQIDQLKSTIDQALGATP